MIYCFGLPRSGGQTLVQAFATLYPDMTPLHSIEYHKWNMVDDNTSVIVEVFAPLSWCERNYTNRPHVYILNMRDPDPWLASCQKFVRVARIKKWNHPLWLMPESQWLDYYDEYYESRAEELERYGTHWFYFDATKQVDYQEICDHLGITKVPPYTWPNIDKYGRIAPDMSQQNCSPAVTNEFLNHLQLF